MIQENGCLHKVVYHIAYKDYVFCTCDRDAFLGRLCLLLDILCERTELLASYKIPICNYCACLIGDGTSSCLTQA